MLALANATDATTALMAATDVAKKLGIFGSPTFVLGRELFWGDDRLDDAISWHRHRSVKLLADNSYTPPREIPEPDSSADNNHCTPNWCATRKDESRSWRSAVVQRYFRSWRLSRHRADIVDLALLTLADVGMRSKSGITP